MHRRFLVIPLYQCYRLSNPFLFLILWCTPKKENQQTCFQFLCLTEVEFISDETANNIQTFLCYKWSPYSTPDWNVAVNSSSLLIPLQITLLVWISRKRYITQLQNDEECWYTVQSVLNYKISKSKDLWKQNLGIDLKNLVNWRFKRTVIVDLLYMMNKLME